MAKKKTVRVATFNANSVRSRLPIIMDWLREAAPDVLCLQETKVVDGDFPKDAFAEAGYHVAFRGEKSYNGVAVATRGEPEEAAFGFPEGEPRDETRLARLVWRGLPIVNTYVPQGRTLDSEHYACKLRWFARLREMFAAHYSPDRPLVWAGDLNVAPTPLDLHDPKSNRNHVCFHEGVRAAFAETLAWGLTDLFRQRHPDEPGCYSFWDYRVPAAVNRGIGWRVDHILGTEPVAKACRDCRIDKAPRLREKPSDHTFVLADLAL